MATRLNEFQFLEVLNTDATAHRTILLGEICGKSAIVTIGRATLPPLTPKLPITGFRLLEENGIYSWGMATLEQDVETCPSAKIDVIYPATETHISKYRSKPMRVVVETPTLYENVVKPYIETMRGDRLAWVRAILHEGAEADDILYRDDDFVLLPNQKWDRKSPESLYLLAIVMQDDLASIRSLNINHIPLLNSIRLHTLEIVKSRWNLEPSAIKLYLHYQPSYYHLHMHITNANYSQDDFGKSILLDNVIDMITARPNGLHAATISYLISEGHELYPLLERQRARHETIDKT